MENFKLYLGPLHLHKSLISSMDTFHLRYLDFLKLFLNPCPSERKAFPASHVVTVRTKQDYVLSYERYKLNDMF